MGREGGKDDGVGDGVTKTKKFPVPALARHLSLQQPSDNRWNTQLVLIFLRSSSFLDTSDTKGKPVCPFFDEFVARAAHQ